MRTLTSGEIDYACGCFKAWCAENDVPVPSAEHALAYFAQAQALEPFMAELMDGDAEDFLTFLRERQLLRA